MQRKKEMLAKWTAAWWVQSLTPEGPAYGTSAPPASGNGGDAKIAHTSPGDHCVCFLHPPLQKEMRCMLLRSVLRQVVSAMVVNSREPCYDVGA